MTQGWHHQDIIAEVRKRGSSLSRLAQESGYARNTFHCALYSPRYPANKAISNFLGVPLHELWPQWYGADEALLPVHERKKAS